MIITAFEAPTVVAGLDDVAMVGQAVEQRSSHLGVAEHAGPFAEGEVGGDNDRGASLPDGIGLSESTSARQRLHRRQLSFVELVVAAAPNGCTHIDIADSRSHRSEFFE
jgi:hypothetical protein